MVKKRGDIKVQTYNKVFDFLKSQKEYEYISVISKKLKVDLDSLKLILTKIKHKTDDKGRVKC